MNPIIKVFLLPGGALPTPGKNGDVGYDASVRAIVSPTELDKERPYMRHTLWNLRDEPPYAFLSGTKRIKNRWTYFLKPYEKIHLGLGLVFGGPSMNWYAELAPRSSSGNKLVEVKNFMEGVPIDPNFRGEPTAVLINYGAEPLPIFHGVKLTQFKFYCTCCGGNGFIMPELKAVSTNEELGETNRGTKWNNSSEEKIIQGEFDLVTTPPLHHQIGPQ